MRVKKCQKLEKVLMVWCLLLVGYTGTGCATRTKYTVFLKESTVEVYNLKGDKCRPSGWTQIERRKAWILTESYYNCDIFLEREMEERELELWGIPKNKVKGDMQ